MVNYRYSAVNQTGQVVRGRLEARNLSDLEKRVNRLGLSLISSDEIGGSLSVGGGLFQRRVTKDELSQFCFYVERLVAGGVPLLEGLSDVRDSVSNPSLRNTIGIIIQDVEQGATLSQAMRQHPKVFDDVFVSLVEAGEFSGELDLVLRNIGDNIKWQDEIIKKTKKAVRYPLFAFVVLLLATWALMVLVVPQLTRLLKSLGQDLPVYTIALISTSDFLQNQWKFLILTAIGIYVTLKILVKTIPGTDYFWDKVKIRVPGMGPVVEKLLLSRFSNVFGLLYGAGVSVIDALKISRGALGNRFVARGLDQIIESITNGQSISQAFRESGLFPPLVIRMIKLGETTGGVDAAMYQVKSYYDRDANEAIESAQGMIQPVMLLLLAGLLAWVIIAVYGPLYDLVGSGSIGG
ncbi:type II secretion system F family protein [Candidatus Persebacteraceae bacterium Df01]|jgi:type IV pilus assembly protein PilC|uniref:Type II secretion system F family protein n=1 Tax=Candidatus Doriopsillibacter californiensis TaxID=2970740 RepID=A0ABT7QJB0_9GAMM|nr:type II secretion system F family protein [Candidatus Persebacteraceae bacterium Df01]